LAADADHEYELILTPPARRALTERPPEAVAAAVINFLTSTLVREPRRVGKPLRDDLAGIWSARRGSYRVLYRLREDPRESSCFESNTAAMSIGRYFEVHNYLSGA
jgi:mRNA-degrading endonuclease RelE of RelBE toxin-antitoxin system